MSDSEERCVYFVKCQDAIKIGYTTDLQTRLLQFATSNPFPMVVLGTIPGGTKRLEQELHDRLGEYRIRNEWFKDHPNVRFVLGKTQASGTLPDFEFRPPPVFEWDGPWLKLLKEMRGLLNEYAVQSRSDPLLRTMLDLLLARYDKMQKSAYADNAEDDEERIFEARAYFNRAAMALRKRASRRAEAS